MANRTTVKSNIVTQNVPTVTNAILTGMLNTELADNVCFREDVAVIQNSVVSPITVDFTGKDRVDLTRTGGSLAITVTGMGDGETKFLLITKTAGQAVTFVGVTDVTPVKTNADALSLVLYEIVRKGSYFFAKAWVESVVQATDSVLGLLAIATSAEHNALSSVLKACVPGRLPQMTTTQRGLSRAATSAEIDAGTTGNITVIASELKRIIDALPGIRANKGTFVIGDIDGDGYQEYTVPFTAPLTNTNYKVLGQLNETTENRPSTWLIRGKTINNFILAIWARDTNSAQNLSFDWELAPL